MMFLYFLLLTALDLRVFDIQEEYYLLVNSGLENEELSFSTYRVPNPERVVLEIDGKISGMPEIGVNEKLVSRVQLKKSEASVRFVFFVEENVFYNIFNRKNTLLIAFKKGLFLSEGNMDTVLDDVRNRLEKIRKEKEEEKKIAELKEKQKNSSVEPDRKKKSYELALAEQWKEKRERKKQREEEKRKK
ncbi:MAG: AMIN domain-containing protein, partial [bacterium]